MKIKVWLTFAYLIVMLWLTACTNNPATTPTSVLLPPPNATRGAMASASSPAPSATTIASPTAVLAPTLVPSPTAKPIAPYTGRIVLGTSDGQVVVVSPDGSTRLNVAEGRSPLFAPDGKRVAFLSVLPSSGPVGQVAIVATNLDGTGKQQYCVSDGNAELTLARWSPHGAYIALNGAQNPPGSILLCNTATKKLAEHRTRQGTAGLIIDWTPDGEFAVWQVMNSGTGEAELYYGDFTKNGADAVKVTRGQNRADFASAKIYTGARISPDGRTVAVAGSKIFFIGLPRQNSALNGQVIEGVAQPSRLAWSPDGRALVVSDRATKAVYVVDVASKQVTKLTDNAEVGDWSRQ